jgi:hypothetical protein
MAYRVRQVTAVIVQVDDYVGTLSQVLHALRDAGLNMVGVASQSRQGGMVHVLGIPEEIEAARSLAMREGVSIAEREVFLVEGDDQVGALCEVTDKISGARINIEDIYALATEGKYAAVYVVAAADVERAAEALGVA